ncbi:MAG: ABC transporter substrate-binding protein [Microlunatus sp.]
MATAGTLYEVDPVTKPVSEARDQTNAVAAGHPYFTASVAGAKDEAKILDPNSRFTVVSSEWDIGKQDNQINDFIAAGVNLILLNAADPQAIGPAVKRAKNLGIVVAAFDVAAEGADVTVMTDNVKAGAISCEELAKQIGQKGDVVIINGPSVSSVIDRVAGCKSALAKYPDIKITSDNQNPGAGRDGGLKAMQGFLTRFPHIDGVFAINDEQAIGADLAAKQVNRNEMKIAAVDGSPAGIDAIRSGTSRIVVTASQDPYQMAVEAVDMGAQVLNGKKLDKSTILLTPKLVTAQNAAQTEGWPMHK